MRARLSIVIPTLNAEATLPAVLIALMEGVEAGLVRELIVTDGGSQDATRAIAEEVGAIWITDEAGRGGQLARGCAKAGGDWMLVLHADSVPGPGWVEAVERGMLRPGEELYSVGNRHKAKVRADGTLIGNDVKGSIHQVGAHLEGAPSCNGWTFWHFEDEGLVKPLDAARQLYLLATED